MNQAISCGHEVTLAVAKEILREGGNAIDAAIGAHMAMFVAEPCMASAGGNGFCLVYEKQKRSTQYFDFFCQTPANKQIEKMDFSPVELNFGEEVEEFHIGLAAAAVPGSIAAIFALHEAYGTMPMKDLVAPAIQLAKDGVALNTFQAFDVELLSPIYAAEEKGRSLYFNEGIPKQKGDIIKMPDLADFLDFVAKEGKAGFYQGEIAERIAKDSRERGGFLTRQDFENYQVNIGDPLNVSFFNKDFYLPNGPSKGGFGLILFLKKHLHENNSIPDAIKETQLMLNDETHLISNFYGYYPDSKPYLQPGIQANRGTTHINILDKWGNAVALTSSIGEGCGYFIPGTDMQLNNMLGEIFLLPAGPHSWLESTRMHSMMTPMIITDRNGVLEFVTGSGGAGRIPFAIAQVIKGIYHDALSLEDATTKARLHYQDKVVQVEAGADWPSGKSQCKYWKEKSLYFGGVHSIAKNNEHIVAMGDDRRYGVAEVF